MVDTLGRMTTPSHTQQQQEQQQSATSLGRQADDELARITRALPSAELVVVLADSSFQRFSLDTGLLLCHTATTPVQRWKQERVTIQPALLAQPTLTQPPTALSGASHIVTASTSVLSPSQATHVTPNGFCTAAALSPLGHLLLCGSSEPLLRCWDYHSRPVAPHVQTLLAHGGSEAIHSILFSTDGKKILTVGTGEIAIWRLRVEEKQLVQQLYKKKRWQDQKRLNEQAQHTILLTSAAAQTKAKHK